MDLFVAVFIGIFTGVLANCFTDGDCTLQSLFGRHPYPKLKGIVFEGIYPDDPKRGSERVEVQKQRGPKISGVIVAFDGIKYNFKGRVTQNRTAVWHFEPIDKGIDDYGAGMAKLDFDDRQATGYVLFWSRDSSNEALITPRRISLKKVGQNN